MRDAAAATDLERFAFSAVGLVWQKEPPAAGMSWADAKAHSAQLDLGGRGWRLPTKDELKALYDSGTPLAPRRRLLVL